MIPKLLNCFYVDFMFGLNSRYSVVLSSRPLLYCFIVSETHAHSRESSVVVEVCMVTLRVRQKTSPRNNRHSRRHPRSREVPSFESPSGLTFFHTASGRCHGRRLRNGIYAYPLSTVNITKTSCYRLQQALHRPYRYSRKIHVAQQCTFIGPIEPQFALNISTCGLPVASCGRRWRNIQRFINRS